MEQLKNRKYWWELLWLCLAHSFVGCEAAHRCCKGELLLFCPVSPDPLIQSQSVWRTLVDVTVSAINLFTQVEPCLESFIMWPYTWSLQGLKVRVLSCGTVGVHLTSDWKIEIVTVLDSDLLLFSGSRKCSENCSALFRMTEEWQKYTVLFSLLF